MALKFRRGTTAQKSGSLAFGEPYVNTTLGTLQIGGNAGDITLSSVGTGSNLQVGGISGSSLDITGNAKIDGNLTLGGQLTIGDATSDTVNVVASLSSSLIPQTTNAFDLGSATKIWKDLYISTGSIKFVAGTTVVKELSLATIAGLESATGSSDAKWVALGNQSASFARTDASNVFANDQTFSGSINLTGRVTAQLAVSASSLDLSKSDGNVSIKLHNSTTGRGFDLHSYDGESFSIHDPVSGRSTFRIDSGSSYHTHLFGDLYVSSGSIVAQNGITGSIGAYNGVVSGSSQVTLQSTTGFTSFNTELATVTGSLISSASNANGRLSAIEAVSGTFARTNSTNTFNGNQTISGSLIVTQDLTILGSSSIQNISSSTLNIGTNLITVAVNQPSVRFGGLSVIDSGSSGASGSFLYDSVQDEFIFVHKGNGLNVTSSHFILGPETIDNLGNETYLTNNRLPKGTGKEHLVDSQISDDGSIVSIGGALTVTGNITGPIRATNGVVSGSSQVIDILSSLNTYTGSNNTTNTTQNSRLDQLSTASGSAITRLTALEVETSNLETFSSSALTRITNLEGTDISITLTGDVTGTGTITNLGNVSFATTVAANSVALGTDTTGDYVASLVAGTGVTLSNNSGEGATPTIAIGQAVATSSSPTFAGLTINGAITATGDITAFFTSDKRHKNNIQIIPNALEKVSKLNGVTWEWNDDVNEVTKQSPKTGLIAQEVLEVLPEVVKQKEDGYLGLDYTKMIGLLVEAIKEQQSQIEELKSKLGYN